MKKAFIFPGQGSQAVGMGKDFYDAFLIAKETFQEADDLLKISLSKIIFEGPQNLLTETKNSQLAIFITSMAILRVLEKQFPDLQADVCSGLSLGEYTALCSSKRASFEKTLLLIQQRSFWMNQACEKVPGTMAAVLGLSFEEIVTTLKDSQGVWIANFNAPGQTVISGTKEGVEAASSLLKQKGAKRVLPLLVHGAFHSGLMQMAQDSLEPHIMALDLQESLVDFVMNVPGDYVRDPQEIKKNLLDQVTCSVKWEQGVFAMKKAGVQLFLEIGFGKVLTALGKKMEVPASLSVGTVEDLEKVYAAT